uniref:Uncharacterized protein LOC100186737 n=1 Tax=Phallusia mammillata TaxID=59560 RepID=A0A6F9DJ93_9ASCI|nr:uncharacterized protein LOC100186737 [Phallusia mammillata]
MNSEAEKILQKWKDKASDSNPVKELQCRLCSETFHGEGMFVESLIHLQTSHSGYFESQQHSISSSTEVDHIATAEENSNTLVSSSSRDEALQMSNADEICVVEKMNQTTQTNRKSQPTDMCTQTDFAIPLPIPEPLKRFLCLSENPGNCRPYLCLICNKPVLNLKIAVMHLRKRHNISLRSDAKRIQAPANGSPLKLDTLTSAKVKIRKTARKSTTARLSLQRSTSVGTGQLVQQVLNTMPSSPESHSSTNRDVAIAIMTSRSKAHVIQSSSDDGSDDLMNLFVPKKKSALSGNETETSKNGSHSSDEKVRSLSAEKSTTFKRFYGESKHLSPLKPSSSSTSDESSPNPVTVSAKKATTPQKAKKKIIQSFCGEGMNRHQQTVEKRAMFLEQLKERRKNRPGKNNNFKVKKKFVSPKKQTPKSPARKTGFEWKSIEYNSTCNRLAEKSSVPKKTQSTTANTTPPASPETSTPMETSPPKSKSTDREIPKTKNTARKTARPPKSRTPSDDSGSMDINQILGNSLFVTTKPSDAERDVVSPDIFEQSKIVSRTSPSVTSHSHSDVKVKRQTSRKTTRSKLTSTSLLDDVKRVAENGR